MIESRLQAQGRITIPPAVREALGLKPGDLLRYEIDGDQVVLSKAGEEADDLFTDEELQPIIDAAVADLEAGDEGLPVEEVMAMLYARIEELSKQSDAA